MNEHLINGAQVIVDENRCAGNWITKKIVVGAESMVGLNLEDNAIYIGKTAHLHRKYKRGR